MSDLGEIVGILKAAGETTRLRLLALLARGELSVKDMTGILGQSQPRVSRHLRLLAEAGLVLRYAEGAWAYYRIAEAGPGAEFVGFLKKTLGTGAWLEDIERLAEVRRARQIQADAYFAKIAANWDALRSLHIAEADVEQAILDMAGPKKAECLIDLGTGTGRILELLADRYVHGIGIDASREMLTVARARLSRTRIENAVVRMGDIVEYDSTIGTGDLVILHQVLHYFDDPGQALAGARRALAPGGRMIVVDFAPHGLEFLRTDHEHRRLGLSTDQMNVWTRAAGLEVLSYRELSRRGEADGLTVCLWLLVGRSGNGRMPGK